MREKIDLKKILPFPAAVVNIVLEYLCSPYQLCFFVLNPSEVSVHHCQQMINSIGRALLKFAEVETGCSPGLVDEKRFNNSLRINFTNHGVATYLLCQDFETIARRMENLLVDDEEDDDMETMDEGTMFAMSMCKFVGRKKSWDVFFHQTTIKYDVVIQQELLSPEEIEHHHCPLGVAERGKEL